MNNYKGVGIVFLRKFVQAHGLKIEYAFIEKLNQEQTEVYINTQSGDWIPVELAAQLYAIAAPLLYPGDALGLQHLGRERAKDNFSGIYKSLLSMATIPFLVQQAAKLWRVSYDTGNARVERDKEKNQAVFIVENYPELPETLREVGCGYIKGVVEFAKVQNVQVTRNDLDPNAWKWIITWD